MMRVTVEESRLWLQSQTRKSRIRRVCIVKNARRCSPRTCPACAAISIYAARSILQRQLPGENLILVTTCAPAAVTKSTSWAVNKMAEHDPWRQNLSTRNSRACASRPFPGSSMNSARGSPTHAAVSKNFFRVTRDIAEKRVSRYESIPNPCTRLAMSASEEVFLALATNS